MRWPNFVARAGEEVDGAVVNALQQQDADLVLGQRESIHGVIRSERSKGSDVVSHQESTDHAGALAKGPDLSRGVESARLRYR